MLLDVELVQKDILLTNPQKTKIEALNQELSEAYEKISHDNPETPASQKEETPLQFDKTKPIKTKDGSVTYPVIPRKPSQRELKIKQATKEVDERIQSQLDDILLPEQFDRLWEILLQTECFFQASSEAMGGLPELDKELYKMLEISEEHVNEINSIHRNAQKEAEALFHGAWMN